MTSSPSGTLETSDTVSREIWTSAREGKATGTKSKAQAGKALGVQRRALQAEETDLGLGHGFLVRKDAQAGLQGKPPSLGFSFAEHRPIKALGLVS